MKTYIPYLVLFLLFLAGIRQVNRQHTYARSRQQAVRAEPAISDSLLAATNSASPKPLAHSGLITYVRAGSVFKP